MGTESTTKFIRNDEGTLTEEKALITSAGAADAHKLPALNESGVLDPTLLNAADTSAGATDAGKVVQLDGAGRIHNSMLPVGMGADTTVMDASEALAAGDLVNIWNDAGTAKVRKADASAAGKEAQGFVLEAVATGAPATVYFEGTNTQLAGLTAGVQFLSATTPGRTTAVAPVATAQVVQRVGFAVSATAMSFQSGVPIVLA